MTEEQVRQLMRWKQCDKCANLNKGMQAHGHCNKLQIRILGSALYERHGCIYYREHETEGAQNND